MDAKLLHERAGHVNKTKLCDMVQKDLVKAVTLKGLFLRFITWAYMKILF